MMTRVRFVIAASVLALAAIVAMLWVTGGVERHHRELPAGGASITAPPEPVGAQTIRAPGSAASPPQTADAVAPGEHEEGNSSTPERVPTGSNAAGRDHPDESQRPGKVIPHPLDEARLRDLEQRQLFADVEAAIEREDYERARSLLTQHDLSFSENEAWSDRREAYQLIADCKQYPSLESRASGQRFVAQQRGSTLRRSVRRACLHRP